MFSKIRAKIHCWLCDETNKRFKTCEKCKKIVCGDCRSTVFVSGGNICHGCLMKNYN